VWHLQSNLFLLVLASLTGIIGAVLAVFFQKFAVGLAGFAGGGYIALNLLNFLGIQVEHIIWLPILIGGIIGTLMVFFIFDWALIIVSSFSGAAMIVQALRVSSGVEQIVYFALVIVGIVIQSFWFRKSPSDRTHSPSKS
jgi:hypothetical protein